MADLPGDDLMKVEKAKEHLEVLKATRKVTGEIEAAEARKLIIADSALRNLKEVAKDAQDQVKEIERQLEAQKQLREEDRTFSEEKIKRYKEQQKELENLIKFQKDHRNEIKKELAETAAGVDELRKKAREDSARALEETTKAGEEFFEQTRQGAQGLEKSMADISRKDVLAGIGATVGTVTKAIEDIIDQPAFLLMNTFKGLGTSVKKLREEILMLPAEMERDITGMVKSTGLGIEELGDTFVDALDPEYAMRVGIAFDEAATPMANIGLKTRDVKSAMDSLMGSTRLFRPEFMRTERAAAAFVANTVAGLGKLGVKTATSAKVVDTLTKAMRVTPKEAARSLGSITNVADSLGLSMGKVMDDFQGLTGNLSQFGDRMTEVFADLQAQAQATGVEVGRLAQFAEGLDTFDKAAKAAQGLNAVLGQSAISVTDLVHADPADKIAMIQDAIAGAGIDFENADRRMKQVIATAAGFKNVEEASRVLLNKEEAEESAKAVDTSQMKQEEFTKRIRQSMTTAEKMTSMTNKMAGGMKRVLGAVRPAAEQFSKGIGDSFGKMATETKNSTLAVMELQALLAGVDMVQASGRGLFKDLSERLGAKFGIPPELAKSIMETTGKLVEGGVALQALSISEEKAREEGKRTPDIPLSQLVRPKSEVEKQEALRQMAEAETPTETPQVVANVYLNGNKVGDAVTATVVSNIGGTQDRGLLTGMA